MGYLEPTTAPVAADWQNHRDRTPPSAEPGTDYACAYGTPIKCAGAGTVSVVDASNAGAEGRRVSIDLDDGRRVSYIHNSRIRVSLGQRVGAGATVADSGASGNGSDWYYGPHSHTSLFEYPAAPYSSAIDFERYVGEEEEEDMKVSYFSKTLSLDAGGTQQIRAGESAFLILSREGGGTNTKLCTGPNESIAATMTLELTGLPTDPAAGLVHLEPVLTQRQSNGTVKDTSLGRMSVPPAAGHVRIKLPISCKLTDADAYLRVRVIASSAGAVTVTAAGIRGGEFTR